MTCPRPRLGAHMSIAGGVDKAIERGAGIGCETIQIFTKNTNQWRARPLDAGEVQRFHALQPQYHIFPVVGHAAYLINLASPDDALWERSLEAFIEELQRAEQLGLPGLVVHPGAHMGAGEEAGLRRIAEAVSRALQQVPGRVEIWLETTAGQGTVLGGSFAHLQRILEHVTRPARIGFCLDTAHVAAAGYEIRHRAGYEAMWAEWDTLLGVDRVRIFHLNDLARPVGARIDRHAHIGQGVLGLEPFRMLLNDPRFTDRPMVLETPKGKDLKEDVENLRVLRSLFE
ncbi:MAG: deoxyribonuclease IV [Anaerolineae bacterium]